MGIVFIMHYLFFFGDEEYHNLIRQTLYNYILNKEESIINNNFCFNLNIAYYSLDANSLNYLPILYYNIDNNNYYNIPLVILNCNSHIKHYNLLFYNKTISIIKII